MHRLNLLNFNLSILCSFLVLLFFLPKIQIFSQANHQIEKKGWDPGLNIRRITTFKKDSTYFESCPDEPNGCYSSISSGGGFYTLSPDFGNIGIPCKVNSRELFDTKSVAGQQSCPYYFNWGQTSGGKLTATITTNTLNWTSSNTPHNYLGFQENIPYGEFYFGGKDLPLIDNFYYKSILSASITDKAPEAIVRFLIGISWYVSNLNKSIVLELNLDNANVNTSTLPELDINQKVATSAFCPQTSLCLYLGGKYWGYNGLINQGPQEILINWSSIVKQLIQDNLLPAQAIGPYQVSAYSGQEIFGRTNVSMEINGLTLYSLTKSSSIIGDINTDGKVDIFDYNLLVSGFGKSGLTGLSKGDLNNDGKVDIFDYNILVGNFGKTQ